MSASPNPPGVIKRTGRPRNRAVQCWCGVLHTVPSVDHEVSLHFYTENFECENFKNFLFHLFIILLELYSVGNGIRFIQKRGGATVHFAYLRCILCRLAFQFIFLVGQV